MANRRNYEWVVECYDNDGNILDCIYWDETEFPKAKARFTQESAGGKWANVDFALCQHSWVEHSCGAIDDEDRQYFYIEEGKFLPSMELSELPPNRFNKYPLAEVSR